MSRVAAVVVSYRARPYLEACLRSLDSVGGLAEIVVVDNASQDGTAEAARMFDGIRVIENGENRGFAAAANQGAEATTAPYVLLLNSDVELTIDALAALLAELLADPRHAAACARLVTAEGRDQLPFRTDRTSTVQWAPGACLLLKRSACDEVGWFDEKFFFYNEDVDLGIRLRRSGWRIRHVPAAAVIHHEGKSTDAVRHETIVHGYRGGLYLIEKHYKWALGAARAAVRAEIRLRGAWYRRLRHPTEKQRAFLAALPALSTL
jgi:GT2 family glycosyltransferase